jgi:hypothetical protein
MYFQRQSLVLILLQKFSFPEKFDYIGTIQYNIIIKKRKRKRFRAHCSAEESHYSWESFKRLIYCTTIIVDIRVICEVRKSNLYYISVYYPFRVDFSLDEIFYIAYYRMTFWIRPIYFYYL